MNQLWKVLLAASVLVGVAGPRYASAQEARSLEQLQVLVKPGDTVWVTDSAGKELKGRIDQLSSSTLRLKSKGVIREFPQSEVSRIRHSDSLKNGTLIGTGVGAAFGAIGLIGACAWNDCAWGVAFEASWAGIGALTGLGIDAMHGHQKTIYRAPIPNTLNRIRIVPLASAKTRGVLVSMSF